MSKLKLADELSLPLSVVTEKLAFLGRTGSGKTYAAMKLAELMLDAGAQIIALDAVGKWYGLRVAGTGPGFQIPVFGGLQGDYPLESTGGKLIADILVDRVISAVLDVSQFTHGEQNRFALDFATQFYQRKKAAPSAVHVFLEECQEFVPQNAMPGEQAMLSAFERLWKLGRNFGIGGSLISQRPQEINKKALNQTGTLVVFGMTGPQERKAIELWVSAQGVDEDIAEILPTLTPGHPHVWSPTFLNVSKTVAIATKQTADVSSTPVVGKGAKAQPLTPIDAEQLREQMKATIEKAKADDPRELKKQLAQVRGELLKVQHVASQITLKQPVLVHQSVLTDADRELLRKVIEIQQLIETDDGAARVQSVTLAIEAAVRDNLALATVDRFEARRQFLARLESARFQKLLDKLERVSAPPPAPTAYPPQRPLHTATRPSLTSRPSQKVEARPAGENGLGASAHRLIDQLAALESLGYETPSKTQLAVWADVSPTSGGYFNNLGKLRSAGLVHYPQPDHVALTQEGREKAAPPVQLSVDEMQDALCRKVGPSKAAILQALIALYPKAITKDDLAEQIGVSPTSGGYFNNLGALRTLGVIDYPMPGSVHALPVLFLGER